MRKYSKMNYVLCVLVFLFAACKKNNTTITETTSATPATVTPPTNTTTPPVTVTPSYEVGTGSGNLTIDGAALDLSTIKLIRIKAGTYGTITIKNISATADKPIYIKNNGQVVITGSMATYNVTNLTIAGDNSTDIQYGFSFENINYRAIRFDNKMNGVTIKNMSFKNVKDYVMTSEYSGMKYLGTAETRTENFKILNCLFDNAGTIAIGGNLNSDTGEDTGLYKDVEIAYNTFKNTSTGSVCSFTNVQDYNIHNNIVDNVNQSNNDHNGIFFMQGNGKFHDNKLTNYQGNSIRMWLYSRGSTPVTVEIYNNICYNTRKYGAFELQGFTRHIYSGKSTFANAKVYNNTVGHMNVSKDWEGVVLDLYNYGGGTLEYYNNLGFDLYSTKSITNMINNMSDTKIIKEQNNKYFSSSSSAVADLNNFVSLITGLGAQIL